MDTLTLLAPTTPGLQLIDAEACGFAQDVPVAVLSEVDGSWWTSSGRRARISELRRHYPGVTEL